jgi:hypothetical protein
VSGGPSGLEVTRRTTRARAKLCARDRPFSTGAASSVGIRRGTPEANRERELLDCQVSHAAQRAASACASASTGSGSPPSASHFHAGISSPSPLSTGPVSHNGCVHGSVCPLARAWSTSIDAQSFAGPA